MKKPEPMHIKNNAIPVVVLVSSQHGGVGLIRSLGRAGVRVYGVHQDSWEPAAWSRYLRGRFRWSFARESNAESLSFLLDVARKIATKPILIATSDTTASFVAENAADLRQEYLTATPTAEIVQTFSSKKNTADACEKIGIPTPRTAQPSSPEEVLDFAMSTKFPVVVKGEYGEFLHRDNLFARVAIVPTKEELLQIFALNVGTGASRLIFQEYIPGGDDTIWMFNGYFNGRSECLFGATGRKLRQFPPHRGSTCLGICEANAQVDRQTKQLMRAVGYTGPVDLGYRYDSRDGQYKLLDVNPRIGSTFRLFTAENGLDVARALYLDLTGQSVPPAEVVEGRKWIVETNDLVSSWTGFRERQFTSWEWLRSLRDVQEGVWFSLDDPRPIAALPFLWLRRHLVATPVPYGRSLRRANEPLANLRDP